MEKIKVEREAIVLDTTEKNKLIALLQYCRHRFVDHPESGINGCGADKKFVDYLLVNL